MDTYGVPNDFSRLVSRMVQNVGRSVVLVRVQAADAATATEQFRGYGGQVLRATLGPKHSETVPWVMAARTEAAAQGEAATH